MILSKILLLIFMKYVKVVYSVRLNRRRFLRGVIKWQEQMPELKKKSEVL